MTFSACSMYDIGSCKDRTHLLRVEKSLYRMRRNALSGRCDREQRERGTTESRKRCVRKAHENECSVQLLHISGMH